MRTTFSITSAALVALAFSAGGADAREIGHGPHHPHHAEGHGIGPHAVHGEHHPHGVHEVHPHVQEPPVAHHIAGSGHNIHIGAEHGAPLHAGEGPGLGVRALPAHPPVHHGAGHHNPHHGVPHGHRNEHHGVAHGHRNAHHGVAHGHHPHGAAPGIGVRALHGRPPARRPGVRPRALHRGGGHHGHRGRRVPTRGRPHGGFGRRPGGRVRRDEVMAEVDAEGDGAMAEAADDTLDKRDDDFVRRDEVMAEDAAEEDAAKAEPAEAMGEALGERHGRFPMHHGSASVNQMSPLLAIAAGVAATYAARF
ncbi:hypothetical protein COEREDRAFT_84762 [Coemansia reversa NRRL 1564]|uniref:Uncharacterized protein n=1 Tax=Coemansia reversa (strain ATCC 12441 / NRRL 1564) TaxID=763665 RepID=A0A2G5BII7_COERN|nr:hypothetical protein COEREDRAFT_84762 [Coemansia reversa NRRL 1564]|eukprot:PIA18809.1 hypothetical protein COEREDRAFT_84762 [Coemansia reversa NRRL 1564]